MMDLFFDTSAVVPLLLVEPHSERAVAAWEQVERVFAWRWMEVGVEAALGRRQAPPEAWAQWRAVSGSVHWLEMESSLWGELRAFNRSLKLRAADAGHLFVFDRALGAVPELKLVSFDREMVDAAGELGLPVWG